MDDLRREPPTRAETRRDIALAAALLGGGILSAWLGQVAGFYGGDTPPLGWGLVYAAGLTLPLAVRRRAPAIVLVVVAVVFFIGTTARIPDLYVGNICLFIAMYTVGAWVDDRRQAFLVRAAVVAAMFVWLVVVTFIAATAPSDEGLSRVGAFSPFAAYALIQFLVNVAFFGGASWFGDRAHASALGRVALALRTAELERERELTAAQAVALDRVAIARELHDVVAHHVSAMGVQAGAARTVLATDPDAARETLTRVERSAREGLAELRSLLDTLRTPGPVPEPVGGPVEGPVEGPAGGPGASTLRLADLDGLIEHARDAGMPTTLTIVGEPRLLPELVDVNLYRVAQEALTNARRHGGPQAEADVRVRWTADAVEVEVANTGVVRPAAVTGLGHVGMRERMAAVGGVLDAGPRARGGFLVRARVPTESGAHG